MSFISSLSELEGKNRGCFLSGLDDEKANNLQNT